MHSDEKPSTSWSFIALMAILMSFVALAIDAMLPALEIIGKDLHVKNSNDVQLIITSIFIGMGVGLIFFGPFSDSYGRKPAIYLGMVFFLTGCLISIFSQTFEFMIVGRLLQGLGGASCRVTTLSMIRDRFSGKKMAKILSLIMIVFILVPALAPTLGLIILTYSGWRYIFVFIFSLGMLSTLWLALSQRETLVIDRRLPFSIQTIRNGILETIKNRVSRNYTIAAGLVFGSFIGYLSSSQQILQIQYKLGDRFAMTFGCLALAIGLASFANSKWVERFGMIPLCKRALKSMTSLAFIFLLVCFYYGGHPPLAMLLIYLAMTFFCFGILFGNFNALAIQPLGHIAGVANSVISSLQTLISVTLGSIIGQSYDDTVIPMITGFLVLGAGSLFVIFQLNKKTNSVKVY